MRWVFLFVVIWRYWIKPFRYKGNIDHITNTIWCWKICNNTKFFLVSSMCLIWLDIYMISWRFSGMFLSLWAVLTWTLFHLRVSCWLDIFSRTCWTIVEYFLPTLMIHTLVLFLAVNNGSKVYFLLVGRYRTCCGVHSILQW